MANSISSSSPPNRTLSQDCWGPIPSAYKELITELSADGEYMTCSICQVHNPDPNLHHQKVREGYLYTFSRFGDHLKSISHKESARKRDHEAKKRKDFFEKHGTEMPLPKKQRPLTNFFKPIHAEKDKQVTDLQVTDLQVTGQSTKSGTEDVEEEEILLIETVVEHSIQSPMSWSMFQNTVGAQLAKPETKKICWGVFGHQDFKDRSIQRGLAHGLEYCLNGDAYDWCVKSIQTTNILSLFSKRCKDEDVK
jgi:hypothetical protein